MGIWGLVLVIGLAGAFGGFINALRTDLSFALPNIERVGAVRVLHPGTLGNMIVGAGASALSWSLYGPLSTAAAFTQPAPLTALGGSGGPAVGTYVLSLASVAGAVLVGMGGAQWLSNQLDNKILKVAASKAAASAADPQAANEILAASASEALQITKGMSAD